SGLCARRAQVRFRVTIAHRPCPSRTTFRMPEIASWAFPPELQPSAETLRFDLARALDSVVLLRAEIPEQAFTAGILGTERVGSDVVVIGHGGRAHALKARLVSKREFAGYWEYVLDEALFTAPAHPQWGGAALLDGDGRLIGVGSLLVQESVEDEEVQGNMF